MKISKTMVKYYLEYVTIGYFGDHTEPPENFADYDECIDNMMAIAEIEGDLNWLELAVHYLLSHPEIDLTEYSGVYPLSSEELREIIEHLWTRIWPENPLPGPNQESDLELELEYMSVEDWADFRRRSAAG